MSQSKIPLQQVFRSGSKPPTLSSQERKLSISSNESDDEPQPPPKPLQRARPNIARQRTNTSLSATGVDFEALQRFATGRMATNTGRGTRTPQMLEFERQAEERAREQEAMQEERDRMQEAELRMQDEVDRISQEEYEMKQYYEAEALKHAEEIRLHQEGGFFFRRGLAKIRE